MVGFVPLLAFKKISVETFIWASGAKVVAGLFWATLKDVMTPSVRSPANIGFASFTFSIEILAGIAERAGTIEFFKTATDVVSSLSM